MAQGLIPLADQTHHAMVLVRFVIDQLRSKQVIVPPLSVIERLCAEAITRAERRLPEAHQRLGCVPAEGAQQRTRHPFEHETINAGMAATSARGG